MTAWFNGFEAGSIEVDGVRLFVRQGGRRDGPPVLLLHGFPQTHAMWQRVAQRLAPHCRVVLPDLRGYGASAKPPSAPDHAPYAKRAMAADMAALMRALGHARWHVAGHDRGARVAHRLALDHADAVDRLCLIDIVPTVDMYEATDQRSATLYYHWFHLIQPEPLPERMIGSGDAARFYLHWKLGGWGSGGLGHIEPEALADYERAFTPAAIHAMCEDYRAGAGIDLAHDRASRAAGQRLRAPLHLLWGERGVVQALFDPVAVWQAQCDGPVTGRALAAGHYLPEEQPDETADELLRCFALR
jgi:haloacetate dehalogenase